MAYGLACCGSFTDELGIDYSCFVILVTPDAKLHASGVFLSTLFRNSL